MSMLSHIASLYWFCLPEGRVHAGGHKALAHLPGWASFWVHWRLRGNAGKHMNKAVLTNFLGNWPTRPNFPEAFCKAIVEGGEQSHWSARLNRFDPEAHLAHVVERIADYLANRVDEFPSWDVAPDLPSSARVEPIRQHSSCPSSTTCASAPSECLRV